MNAVLRHWNNFTLRLAQAPYWPLALLARFSLAALFWRSGQTKISGFAVDPLDGTWQWGWPQLSDSTIYLFAEEYRLPLLAPEPAALLAALMEHLLALMLLLGIGSRIAAIGLLVMTAIIQLFVYPDAYPTHGLWAVALLALIVRGPGLVSVDHWLAHRFKS
ncbi:hypothetical protein BWQ95_21265 [Aeromonas hydrophila]|jgi:putative oxidoreductase|uniref:DoxX family membrane protein n=2 Tax=Gammaproteobacteria TaxID=1236 RepID=A0A7T3X1X5_AERCA|nr:MULTISPECIES: DoxX family membrane protein [Gammaproteobacteria]MCM6981942.1 DoxX family membrane protein [Enterobacter hormaechei]GJK16935.1 hypothetical protein TUM16664_47140 [Enterobacter cloacae]GJK94311.1 hypothetical protein TUM17568_55170 [Klebsiella oxytoca]HBM3160350.1 DoxX family membrane protein [Klebsiella michiganensis]HDS4128394.1 DoxX family membrane protein [Klebsiella pneumoniae subsp. pneumoniae]HDS5467334.1 DoxX family membrane protein [Enterobacter asburiae]HDT5863341